MIEMKVDLTPLDTRITILNRKIDGSRAFFQNVGQLVMESVLRGLDSGGNPPFIRTRKPTGRPPLGGRSGSIGRSVRIAEVTPQSVTVEAGGLPYNVIHQLGGTIRHPGSSKLQAWISVETSPRGGLKSEKGRRSGLVVTHGTRPHDIPIPARRYMKFYDETVQQIKQLFQDYYLKS
jgi:phage gpG-like protein